MSSQPSLTLIFLPGAGNHPPDLELFKSDLIGEAVPLFYPNWQRLMSENITGDDMVTDLLSQVKAKAPTGPICITGHSLGGHLGYALALRLQDEGRAIAGLCAIDSFTFSSVTPHKDWKQKAVARAWELIKGGRFAELAEFVRSKFWRLAIRVFMERHPSLLKRMDGKGKGAAPADPVLEAELSMRTLLRAVAPWIGSLDEHPRPLAAPSLLLRTGEPVTNDEAWKRRCPDLRIRRIPGHHHSIFDPENVQQFKTAFHEEAARWAAAKPAAEQRQIHAIAPKLALT